MSATPSPSTIIVRPSAAGRRRTLLLSLIVVPFVLISLLTNPQRQWWLIVLFLVLIGGAIAFTVLRMRRLRIEYGEGRYRFVSMYRIRDFTVADIRQVHTFTALRQGANTNADLMVEGHDGRRLMRLPGILWDVALLATLADEFQARGVPLIVAQTPVTAAEVRARFPHLVSWFEANQIVAAVLVGVGTLVLVTIVIVIVFIVLFSSATIVT